MIMQKSDLSYLLPFSRKLNFTKMTKSDPDPKLLKVRSKRRDDVRCIAHFWLLHPRRRHKRHGNLGQVIINQIIQIAMIYQLLPIRSL